MNIFSVSGEQSDVARNARTVSLLSPQPLPGGQVFIHLHPEACSLLIKPFAHLEHDVPQAPNLSLAPNSFEG